MVILQTRVDFTILFLCVMFSIAFAKLNVVKRDFVTTKDRRIRPSSPTYIKQITPSPAACASLCSIQKVCCYASYDRNTKQCDIYESCCQESEPSVDVLILRKFTDSFACQNGRWLKNENKCYYFSEDQQTWENAKIACGARGGIFVEVESKYENDFLKKSASEPRYWLGGTDIQNETMWIWSNSQNSITFADWDSTEPNNVFNNEHCLALWESGRFAWHDVPCDWKIRFICEQDLMN